MKKVVYHFLQGGGYLCMDCPDNCESCYLRFLCFTEGKNKEMGVPRTDSVIVEDRDLFNRVAKMWGKDWLVKAGKGLVDVSKILY